MLPYCHSDDRSDVQGEYTCAERRARVMLHEIIINALHGQTSSREHNVLGLLFACMCARARNVFFTRLNAAHHGKTHCASITRRTLCLEH